MQIPQSDILTTNAMNRMFDTTTATYKFYWLLALLDMHVKEQNDEMLALDVAARMVAYAWYPTQYFRLSFGKGDSMSKIIPDVALLTGITVDDRLEDKSEAISNAISEDREVKKKVKILLNNIPFRFQLFLQSKNPNVPNISGKLLRPEERESLTRQKKFWNKVIEIGGPIRCIYKDTPLGRNEYDLDHFIPWSFVSHNQNWNLIPADSSFNSSNSNQIICETATCVAFYDGYPVSPGHALIIPKRHVASYFDLTNHEREAMNVVLQYVKQKIDERFHPDGYNVGINIGEAAGQSVFHCHMHVIPRYKGDVPNPKGGVRGVIPQKQKY